MHIISWQKSLEKLVWDTTHVRYCVVWGISNKIFYISIYFDSKTYLLLSGRITTSHHIIPLVGGQESNIYLVGIEIKKTHFWCCHEQVSSCNEILTSLLDISQRSRYLLPVVPNKFWHVGYMMLGNMQSKLELKEIRCIMVG